MNVPEDLYAGPSLPAGKQLVQHNVEAEQSKLSCKTMDPSTENELGSLHRTSAGHTMMSRPFWTCKASRQYT